MKITEQLISVNNLICDECRNSIKSALLKTKGVTAVDFIMEENKVSITGLDIQREEMVVMLASAGYHEKDTSGHFTKKNSFNNWYCYCCTDCDS